MDPFLMLFDLIGVLARQRYQTADRCFAAVGLNHTEARLLTLLRQANDVASQTTLANGLFVDRTNAGRALKRLEQDGYIRRRGDSDDKRMNFVEMTAKGRKAVVEIEKLRKKIVRGFFGEMSKDDAGTVVELLRKAISNEEFVVVQKRIDRGTGE